MAIFYRTMVQDDEGKPKIGTAYAHLGARPKELPLDEAGAPREGAVGISLHDGPLDEMPANLRPPSMRGSTSNMRKPCAVFWLDDDRLAPTGLRVRRDAEQHAGLVPASPMTNEEYQAALAATRDLWEKV